MPSISYIVARSYPGNVIGCENQLPWRLKTDMKFFRTVTENHVVIMGRKTFESLGKPLPNRINIVLSTKFEHDDDGVIWVREPETALYIADYFSIINERQQIIVMGGAQIYRVFKNMFTKIFLTEVFADIYNGDAFFNETFDLREWEIIDRRKYEKSAVDEYDFQISILEKKLKYTRNRDISQFYVDNCVGSIKFDLSSLADRISKVDKKVDTQIPLPLPKLVA